MIDSKDVIEKYLFTLDLSASDAVGLCKFRSHFFDIARNKRKPSAFQNLVLVSRFTYIMTMGYLYKNRLHNVSPKDIYWKSVYLT